MSAVFERLGIVSDHAGEDLKEFLFRDLLAQGLGIIDLGVHTSSNASSADYPDFGARLAEKIALSQLDGGIAICGTGLGMAITANKFPGVRAVSSWCSETSQMSRLHNDANVICLGARLLTSDQAKKLVQVWLTTGFSGEPRHEMRLQKLRYIESLNFSN